MKPNVLAKDELPGAAIGERVLLLPDPPLAESDYGLIIPEIAQFRPSTGILLAAGLKALDRLHDNGIQIGDAVIWGRFAGVIWEWDHLHEDGVAPCPEHSWSRMPSPRDRVAAHKCELCGAVRWVECVILANVDDIQASVGLGQRLRSGVMRVTKAQTAEGITQHIIEREGA